MVLRHRGNFYLFTTCLLLLLLSSHCSAENSSEIADPDTAEVTHLPDSTCSVSALRLALKLLLLLLQKIPSGHRIG
jgi:hypothetical protein